MAAEPVREIRLGVLVLVRLVRCLVAKVLQGAEGIGHFVVGDGDVHGGSLH